MLLASTALSFALSLAPSEAPIGASTLAQLTSVARTSVQLRSPLNARRGFFSRRRSYLSAPYGGYYYSPYRNSRSLSWGDVLVFGFVVMLGSLGRNYRAERVVEGQTRIDPRFFAKTWTDQNAAQFFTNGHLPQGRFLYCLETTNGRHGNAVTQRLRALDDEVTRMGLTFHKMILVSPHPEADTVQKRKSWMVRNKLDERQWSFVTSTRDEVQRLIGVYNLTPSATRDVRVSLVDGRGFVLLSKPLHEGSLQQLANEIITASQQAFLAAQADRQRPVAKGTGSDGIPDRLGAHPYYDDDY